MSLDHEAPPAMIAEGPYFDELAVGQVFTGAPSMTLTEGRAAVHQGITGDRMRLPLDNELATQVAGAPLAHPAFVWNVAIGQSTLATHHVKANLFYRGLVFRRAPFIGDTLYTTTEVAGLRQNRPRPDRRATGLAALKITTVDQDERPVLGFWRCAMLPLRDPTGVTGQVDDLQSVGTDVRDEDLVAMTTGWQLDRFGPRPGSDLRDGLHWRVGGGDVVSSAPELARLTLNVAQVHHDVAVAGGRRLVYGGHTIALALSQATRVLPDIVTVAGWHSCDHTGPVHEGDTLTSTLELERVVPLAGPGRLVHLRSRVEAISAPDDVPRDVLDWRFTVVTI